MKQLSISILAIAAFGAGACSSGKQTTPRQEAEAGRANLERMMQEAGDIGDSGAMGAEMTMDALAQMEIAKKPDFIDYAAVVDTATRPEDDVARDEGRKPAQVLAFAGVLPGMKVFEMEAGGGYFTEILSIAVGEEGEIYMQNPAAFDAFWNGPEPPRLATGRLKNVKYVKSQFDNLKMPDESVDMATWMQGPHELWYTPEGAPDGLGDPKAAFMEVARILKPGGTFLVLDHAAKPGAPESSGGDTHRIDPAIVIGYAEAAGLRLIGSSDLLANPEDPKDISVFDPSIRGKTDQFLLKFEKPE